MTEVRPDVTEVRLDVELPDVEVEPYRIEVRCGKSVANVFEYGQRGSGDWTAWKEGNKYTIDDDHGKNRPRGEALDIARAYVRDQERRRLLHEQLRSKLDNGEV